MIKSTILFLTTALLLAACSKSDSDPKAGGSPVAGDQVEDRGSSGTRGGGKGVLCGDKLETLELYEAREVRKLKPMPAQGDSLAELEFGLWRMDQALERPGYNASEGLGKKVMEMMWKHVTLTAPGQEVPTTDDATLPTIPDNCRVVQLAVNKATKNRNSELGMDVEILINGDYWNLLSPRDQAVLLLHEWFHLTRKLGGVSSSDEVRFFLGGLYASTPPTSRYFDMPAQDVWRCNARPERGGGEYEFFAYAAEQNGKPGYILSFSRADGLMTLARTTAFLTDRTIFESFKESAQKWTHPPRDCVPKEHFGFHGTVDLKIYSKAWTAPLSIRIEKKSNSEYPSFSELAPVNGATDENVRLHCSLAQNSKSGSRDVPPTVVEVPAEPCEP